MTADIFQMVVKFFGNLQDSAPGQQELKRFDRKIEFEVRDGEPFFVEIKGGKASVKQGKPDIQPGEPEPLRFSTFTNALSRLFQGKARYTDLLYHLPGSKDRLKLVSGGSLGFFGAPLTTWVGKLIRIGQEVR